MVVLMTLVVFFLVVWVFGGVQGEEFSAQSFTMRRFRYFQLPLVKLPIWPVSFERVRGNEDAMAKYVRSQLKFDAFGCFLTLARRDRRIVDQHMQTTFPTLA